MKVEIVCVTYARDLEWTEYFLRSVRKYASGFSGVTIIVPWDDLGQFLPFETYRTKDGMPVVVKKYTDIPGKGMLLHEVMICSADIYCPHADVIMHMDSDCLFNGPVTPTDYMTYGKPDIQMVRYDKFGPGRAEHIWRKNVMNALGYAKEEVIYETMQRHPSCYHSFTYRAMRDHIEKIHKCPFDQYVVEQENSFPQGFAEFPTLGAYSLRNYKDAYNFIEIEKPDIQQHPKSNHKVTQFWSHSGRDPKHWELHQSQIRLAKRIVA